MKMKRAQERNGVSEEKNEVTETWRRGLEGRLVCLFAFCSLASVLWPSDGAKARPLRAGNLGGR